MTRSPTAAWTAEILPRYVFLESLTAGRSVLEVGAAAETAGRSTRFLREKGATRVVGFDADPARLARLQAAGGMSPGLEFVAGDLRALPSEAFDLVIHHRAAALLEDPGQLAALKRLLSRDGHLVLVVREPSGLALADLRGGAAPEGSATEALLPSLRPIFRSVEVATQRVFFGYALSPPPEGEPETSLDESLSDTAEPAYRLLLCGLRPSGLNTAALVPLDSGAFRELVAAQPERLGPAVDPLGLEAELVAEEQRARLHELERRAQVAVEEAERSALATAQALAERDHLQAQLLALQSRLQAVEAGGVPDAGPGVPAPGGRGEAEELLELLRAELVARAQADAERASQMAELQLQLEERTVDAECLREKVQTLTLQLSERDAQLALAIQERAQAEDRATRLEAEEQAAEELQQLAGDEQLRLAERNAALEAHAETLARTVEVLEAGRAEAEALWTAEREQAATQSLWLAQEREQLAAQVARLEAQLAEAGTAFAQVRTLEAECARVREALQEAERARDRAAEEAAQLRAYKDALTLQVAEQEVALARAQSECARATARAAELEAESARAAAHVTELEAECTRTTARGVELEVEYARATARITELEAEAEALRRRLAAREEEAREATGRLEASVERAAELERAVGLARQEREEAQRGLRDTQERLEAESQRLAGEVQAQRDVALGLEETLREVAQWAAQVRAACEEVGQRAQALQALQRAVEHELTARSDAAALAATRMQELLARAPAPEDAAGPELAQARSEAERLLQALGEYGEAVAREVAARDAAERAAAEATEQLRKQVEQLHPLPLGEGRGEGTRAKPEDP